MGDIADYYVEKEIHSDLHIKNKGTLTFEELTTIKPFSIWTQANGKEILIKDMTIHHLTNTLHAIKSNKITFEHRWQRKGWIKSIKKEIDNRITISS